LENKVVPDVAFWVVTLCSDTVGYQLLTGPWSWINSDLQNIGVLPCHYTALQTRWL